MSFQPKDHYFKKAKKENFLARSVYKLEEIDKKYRILNSGNRVLDLGAAPGSWSQYALKKTAPDGKVWAVDLQPIEAKDARLFTRELNLQNQFELDEWLNGAVMDVVLSDMAPKTTGIRITDQTRSMELCELALSIAQSPLLRKGGHFVCKLFHSDDFKVLKSQILESFQSFEALRPDSTRSSSKEIFLIGKTKK